MEKILLSTYSIKIKDQKNDQIISAFNGTDDFLPLFNDFTKDIFQNVRKTTDESGNHTLHLTLEVPSIIDEEGRCIYGYFSSGISGDLYRVVDTKTNEPALNVERHHAAFREVFFYLFIPRAKTIGYLVLQRKAKFGIKLELQEAVRIFMNKQGFKKYRFQINNFLHNSVYLKMMELGNLKKVELIKRTIPDSLEKYLSTDGKVAEIPGILKTSFNSSTSLPKNFKDLINGLFIKKNSPNNRIEIENIDEQFDEIEFQLELGGKKKTFYITNRHRIQPDVDVSENVDFKDG